QSQFRLLLLVTTNLGLLFLLLQVVLAQQAVDLGIVVGTTLYAGLLFGLAAFHALHLVVGVIALGILAAMARQGRFASRSSVELRLWGYYWHFVGGCWLFMYVLLFLV
ncbi:MAG: cytochrome c oxidase subunit 3, partial [Myxococcota bacterium]